MKKIILLSLLVMFGCDEDNPVASIDIKAELDWAFACQNSCYCYYTDDDDMCGDYSDLLNYSYKYENIYLIGNEGGNYIVELCQQLPSPDYPDPQDNGCRLNSYIDNIQYK